MRCLSFSQPFKGPVCHVGLVLTVIHALCDWKWNGALLARVSPGCGWGQANEDGAGWWEHHSSGDSVMDSPATSGRGRKGAARRATAKHWDTPVFMVAWRTQNSTAEATGNRLARAWRQQKAILSTCIQTYKKNTAKLLLLNILCVG